jgi:hypothetical protein
MKLRCKKVKVKPRKELIINLINNEPKIPSVIPMLSNPSFLSLGLGLNLITKFNIFNEEMNNKVSKKINNNIVIWLFQSFPVNQ